MLRNVDVEIWFSDSCYNILILKVKISENGSDSLIWELRWTFCCTQKLVKSRVTRQIWEFCSCRLTDLDLYLHLEPPESIDMFQHGIIGRDSWELQSFICVVWYVIVHVHIGFFFRVMRLSIPLLYLAASG